MANDPHEFPLLEIQLRKLADQLKTQLAPEVQFTLFLMHPGLGGGLAYIGTIERDDSIRTMIEWVRHQLSAEVQGDDFDHDLWDAANELYLLSRRPGDRDYVPF